MDANQIEARLKLGEDSATEFKSAVMASYIVDANDIAKEVAALANSGGGLLVVGVENDGTVTGTGTTEQTDLLFRQISQACERNIVPAITCRLLKVEVRDERVLAAEVPGYDANRPFLVRNIYYVRDGSVSRQARPAELERVVLSAGNVYLDEQPVEGSGFDDLHMEAVDALLSTVYGFQRSAHDDEGWDRLRRGHLAAVRGITTQGAPTVTGILFFANDPQRWIQDARVSIVRIAGAEFRADFLDKQEILGRVPDQVAGTLQVLTRLLPAPARVVGAERVDSPGPGGIPLEVLREAVVNAVVHRDYRAPSQIRVFVFDDRLEIVNPGGLLNKLTLENIRTGGISQRRNNSISSLLAKYGRREALGMGIFEMIRIMRKQGRPEPEFENLGHHFRMVLRIGPVSG